MKALARRAFWLALAILAWAPARAAEQIRLTPLTPTIVALPVAPEVLRAPETLSIVAPVNFPSLPSTVVAAPEALTVPAAIQQAVQQAVSKSSPLSAVQGKIEGVRALAQPPSSQTPGGRSTGQEQSHWSSVFDGLSGKSGAVSAAAGAPSETSGLEGKDLVVKLHEISGRGARIKHYDEAKSFMFAKADHVERNGVTGIVDAYSGVFVPGTGPDGGQYAEHGDQNHDGYEDRGGMNVEHVWPQSFFAKAEPMRADLHHLMATFMHPNGERGNLPFGEVKGAPEYHNDAGAKLGGGVFEPPDFAKGRVARSLLYFYTRYYDKRIFLGAFNQKFWDENLPMLLRWNRQYPPDDFERGRNDKVESLQGNRNPYVDDHTLADRVGLAAFKTGNRYGGRRGDANFQGAPAAPPVQPEHLIRGARLRPFQAEAAPKPVRLIITGPPGSGKGTFSEKLSAQYGIPHISVGELLREYGKTHPETAEIMAKGQLVDSALVLAVVRERLSKADVAEKGFILDGFPRRPAEAAALAELVGGHGLDGVITLDVPEPELLRRVLARGRADDTGPVFQDRMKIYREQTIPAVERFTRTAPVLAPAVGGSDILSNYARVKAAVEELFKRLAAR